MAEHEPLSPAGKAGFGAACAVCCTVPMLVLAGVLSLSAVLAGGATIGALALVMGVAAVVIRGRTSVPALARRALAAGGIVASAAGLADPGSSWSTAAVVIGVALLAVAALLVLPEAAPVRR